MNLQDSILTFLSDPLNPQINFQTGLDYESIGQTTSAYSYYLRTAEYSNDPDLIYEALLRSALCLKKQGNHHASERGIYLHAIALLPKRPEAYYLLSQYYEFRNDYIAGYTEATIAKTVFEKEPITQSDLGYPGYYGIIFQQAVTSWWNGRVDISTELFNTLKSSYWDVMNDSYKELVNNNLTFLNS